MFTERRWERRHVNGWTAVVLETDKNWFRAYAVDPDGHVEPREEGTHFAAIRDAAEHVVRWRAPHECRCPAWIECEPA